MLMETESQVISVKGKQIAVPCIQVRDRKVYTQGTWLKIARIHGEEFLPERPVEDAAVFVAALRARKLRADIFTFAERFYQNGSACEYRAENESWAVADTADFAKWWEALPQETRKNVRRSAKRGVEVRLSRFDDALAEGICTIYNETPIRQGRRFWHYGKDLATVKAENSTFLDRSDFICAYFKNDLIGFIKLVYVDKMGTIMQIVAMNAHQDKRPANALIARAVEVCGQKEGIVYLVYGKMHYGKYRRSQMAEFKERNGFQERLQPRYYVPLTLLGRLGLALGLHHGLRDRLPGGAVAALTEFRSKIYAAARARHVPAS